MRGCRRLFAAAAAAAAAAVAAAVADAGAGAAAAGANEAVAESAGAAPAAAATGSSTAEHYPFEAEVSRLMDIIINSLYTRKDVFLRELISNAADALEKVRFRAVKDNEILAREPKMEIRLEVDKAARTLTIEDTGIGMTREELVSNLGTLAHSGTTNFLEAFSRAGAAESLDVNLIGQFGVGFYSAFLVADSVEVHSRAATPDAPQYVWSSDGTEFTVDLDRNGPALTRGTRVVLHLKEDASEFLDERRVADVASRANEFVPFPLMLKKVKLVDVPAEDVPAEEEGGSGVDADSAVDKEESPDSAAKSAASGDAGDDGDATADSAEAAAEAAAFPDVSSPPPPRKRESITWQQLNLQKPIWLRPKEEVTREEYLNFYKTAVAKDSGGTEPLAWLHFKAEGEIEFRALIYIPREPTAWEAEVERFNLPEMQKSNVKVYARRVLVADELPELLPKWMNRIAKGVVDSDDLPLKVDREGLSQHRVMQTIARRVESKVLDQLRRLASEDAAAWRGFRDSGRAGAPPDGAFSAFFAAYNRDLASGCIVDDGARKKLAPLLRVQTSALPPNETESLDNLVDAIEQREKEAEESGEKEEGEAKKGETNLLYVTAENYARALALPHVRPHLRRGEPVIVLTDAFLETCVSRLGTYRGRRFVNAEVAAPGARQKKLDLVFKPLLTRFESRLRGRVRRVVMSGRLTDEVAVIAGAAAGSSAFTERLIAQQRQGEKSMADVTRTRTLELNPRHPFNQHLLKLVRDEERAASSEAAKEADGGEETATGDKDEEVGKGDNDASSEAERAAREAAIDEAISTAFDIALLASGFPLEDPGRILAHAAAALASAVGSDAGAEPRDYEFSDEDLAALEAAEAAAKAAGSAGGSAGGFGGDFDFDAPDFGHGDGDSSFDMEALKRMIAERQAAEAEEGAQAWAPDDAAAGEPFAGEDDTSDFDDSFGAPEDTARDEL